MLFILSLINLKTEKTFKQSQRNLFQLYAHHPSLLTYIFTAYATSFHIVSRFSAPITFWPVFAFAVGAFHAWPLWFRHTNTTPKTACAVSSVWMFLVTMWRIRGTDLGVRAVRYCFICIIGRRNTAYNKKHIHQL
jgi:hypothetical protein